VTQYGKLSEGKNEMLSGLHKSRRLSAGMRVGRKSRFESFFFWVLRLCSCSCLRES